jgi:hypothetical protein
VSASSLRRTGVGGNAGPSAQGTRHRAAIAIAVIAIVISAGVTSAVAGHAPSVASPFSAQAPQGLSDAIANEQGQQTVLSNPAERHNRILSRTADTNLGAGAAAARFKQAFGDVLAPTQVMPAEGGRDLLRFQGPNGALVQDRGATQRPENLEQTGANFERALGSQSAGNLAPETLRSLLAGAARRSSSKNLSLVESQLPLNAAAGDGRRGLVNLDLRSDARGFEPTNPLANVSFPSDAAGALKFGSGLSSELPGTSASKGQRLGSQAVFYPNVASDTDEILKSELSGFETLTQLRSPSSPERLEYRLDAPSGTVLKDTSAGGLDIIQSGHLLADVLPPTAVDSQGSSVPVRLRAEGSNIVVLVNHRDRDVAYPILVDPVTEIHDWYWGALVGQTPDLNSWSPYHVGTAPFSLRTACDPTLSCYMAGPGLYIDAPATTSSGSPVTYTSADNAGWIYTPPRWASDYSQFGARPSTYIGLVATYYAAFQRRGDTSIYPYFLSLLYNPSTGAWLGDEYLTSDTSYHNDVFAPGHNLSYTPDWTQSQAYGMFLAMGSSSAQLTARRDAYLGAASFDLYDPDLPSVLSVQHTAPQSSPGVLAWSQQVTDQVSMTAEDRGLGLKQIQFAIPDETQDSGYTFPTNTITCTGVHASPCPRQTNQSVSYTSDKIPEGVWTAGVTPSDMLWKTSSPAQWWIRIDRSAPEVTSTGGLRRGTGMDLHVAAEDGDGSSARTAASGVKSIEVLVDGVRANVTQGGTAGQAYIEQSCPGLTGSCSLATDFQLDPSQLSGTGHTVKVITTDFAGNQERQFFTPGQDWDPPTVTASGSLMTQDPVGATSQLVVHATDAGSGLGFVHVYLDGKLAQDFGQPCLSGGCTLDHTFNFNLSQLVGGTHYVKVVVEDVLGNKARVKRTINLDPKPPSLRASGLVYQWEIDWERGSSAISYNPTAELDAEDGGYTGASGIARLEVTEQVPPNWGGTGSEGAPTTYVQQCSPTCPRYATADYTYYPKSGSPSPGAPPVLLRFKAIDRAGNTTVVEKAMQVSPLAVSVSGELADREDYAPIYSDEGIGMHISAGGTARGVAQLDVYVDGAPARSTWTQSCPTGSYCPMDRDYTLYGSQFPTGDHQITVMATAFNGTTATQTWHVFVEQLDAAAARTKSATFATSQEVGVQRYATAVRADAPATYWRFGEVSGPTASDASGNGHAGSYGGAPSFGVRGALPWDDDDGAVDLNGTSDYVSSTYSPFVNGATRTFEGWSKRDTDTTLDMLFGGSSSDQGAPYLTLGGEFGHPANRVIWAPSGNNGAATWWDNAWPGTGQWVHWALVFNQAAHTAELFINGQSKGVKTLATPYSASPGTFNTGIWRALNGAYYGFDGQMDEVAIYERGLTAAQIQAHYALSSYETQTQADAPAAEWRLGESGGTAAADSSGAGHAGQYVGNPGLERNGALPWGDDDGAVSLNGSTQYVASSYNPFTNGTTRTFEVWAKRDTNNSNDVVFGSNSTTGMLLYGVPGNTNLWFRASSAGPYVGWANALPTGAWTHLVLVLDQPGNSVTLYENGTSLGTTTYSGQYASTPGSVWLGAWAGGNDDFDGKLEEAAVYEHGLSPQQIQAHYAAGTPSSADSPAYLMCTDPQEPANFDQVTPGTEAAGFQLSDVNRRCDQPDPDSDRIAARSTASDPTPPDPVTDPGDVRADYVNYIYGDCQIPAGADACSPPVEVQVWPICERTLASYQLSPDEGYAHTELPPINGVPAFLFDAGTRLEMYTGDSTVVIFAPDAELAEEVAHELKLAPAQATPAQAPSESNAALPAPAPGGLNGNFECTEAAP